MWLVFSALYGGYPLVIDTHDDSSFFWFLVDSQGSIRTGSASICQLS